MFDSEQLGWFLADWMLLGFLGFFIGLTIITLKATYEIVKKPFKSGKDKSIWLFAVIGFFPVGAVVYFIKRKRLLDKPQVTGDLKE